MPADPHHMTPDQFRAAVRELGFAMSGKANDEGISAAARFFGRAPRTARAWSAEGPPPEVAIALRLMLAGGIDAAKAGQLLAAPARRRR